MICYLAKKKKKHHSLIFFSLNVFFPVLWKVPSLDLRYVWLERFSHFFLVTGWERAEIHSLCLDCHGEFCQLMMNEQISCFPLSGKWNSNDKPLNGIDLLPPLSLPLLFTVFVAVFDSLFSSVAMAQWIHFLGSKSVLWN